MTDERRPRGRPRRNGNSNGERDDRRIQEISFLDGGEIIFEQIYEPENKRHYFIGYRLSPKGKEEITTVTEVEADDRVYRPSGTEIVENDIVKLPQGRYRTHVEEDKIFNEIKEYINKWVELDEFYLNIATLYVMFSWLYDKYSISPYLRIVGDYGSGKSRFLKAVGYLCYKGTHISGASSSAAIFRLTDTFRGTMLLDEADLRDSDYGTAIITILNQGYQSSPGYVMKAMPEQKNFRLAMFRVFGPKIIAMRAKYDDQALESRIINLRSKMSTNMQHGMERDFQMREEAVPIRDKLLFYRLERFISKPYDDYKTDVIPGISLRLNQSISPILSIYNDKNLIEDIQRHVVEYADALVHDRSFDINGYILEALVNSAPPDGSMYFTRTLKEINEFIFNKHKVYIPVHDPRDKKNSISYCVRNDLDFRVNRSAAGMKVIHDKSKLNKHITAYGISHGIQIRKEFDIEEMY